MDSSGSGIVRYRRNRHRRRFQRFAIEKISTVIPVVGLCIFKKIKIEAFSKDWYWFATIGVINLVIPFFLIAYGVKNVQSNLAAILMASTPLSASILAHFFTKNEKINITKTLGVLLGFSGIVFLFSDNILINENNFISAILILCGSTFYVIGGLLTLKISNKKNENVTASILIWGSIIIFPILVYFEKPWLSSPSAESMIALLLENGVTMIDKIPRKGSHGALIAFVHPKSTGGVLVELAQK